MVSLGTITARPAPVRGRANNASHLAAPARPSMRSVSPCPWVPNPATLGHGLDRRRSRRACPAAAVLTASRPAPTATGLEAAADVASGLLESYRLLQQCPPHPAHPPALASGAMERLPAPLLPGPSATMSLFIDSGLGLPPPGAVTGGWERAHLEVGRGLAPQSKTAPGVAADYVPAYCAGGHCVAARC
jgi:hypothetical protein